MDRGVILLFFLSLIIHPGIRSQTLPISHTSLIFRDYERNNRKVRVEVFYPGEINNVKEILDGNSSEKYPVLCFAHGYQLSWSSYSYLQSYLVPKGYIMVFPRGESGMFPSHSDLAKDIAFIIEKMIETGNDTSSLFYDRIDPMNCAMGHSMGGGCAVLAARLSPAVKSLAVLAPYDTKPSSVVSAGSVTVPALIIAGSNDCITPPAKHQLPIFNNLECLQSTLVSINGASHCQMADNKFICNLAEATCRPKAEIESELQHSIVLRYLESWLDYTLKGDLVAGERFSAYLKTDTLITSQVR